jgi:hypothetical protein
MEMATQKSGFLWLGMARGMPLAVLADLGVAFGAEGNRWESLGFTGSPSSRPTGWKAVFHGLVGCSLTLACP